MKYNTRLKCNNATPFLLNNYLLKCAQHMLDVFSAENLSIHHKILIGVKDQFDLHKLLYFFYENKTCTLRLLCIRYFSSLFARCSIMINKHYGLLSKPYAFNFAIKQLCGRQSKAFERSVSKAPKTCSWSTLSFHFSRRAIRQC